MTPCKFGCGRPARATPGRLYHVCVDPECAAEANAAFAARCENTRARTRAGANPEAVALAFEEAVAEDKARARAFLAACERPPPRPRMLVRMTPAERRELLIRMRPALQERARREERAERAHRAAA